MLCGASMTQVAAAAGKLLAISGLGASRAAVDATSNEDATLGWGKVILSCIARGLPFRATVAFSPADDWVTPMTAALADWTLTWPVETSFTTAGTIVWKVGLTEFVITGQLEGRVVAEMTLTPSGKPTFTAGA